MSDPNENVYCISGYTCDDDSDSLEDVLEARKEQTGLVTWGSQCVLQPDVRRDVSGLTVFYIDVYDDLRRARQVILHVLLHVEQFHTYRKEDNTHGQKREQDPRSEERCQWIHDSCAPGNVVRGVHEAVVTETQDSTEAGVRVHPVFVDRGGQLRVVAVPADLLVGDVVANNAYFEYCCSEMESLFVSTAFFLHSETESCRLYRVAHW